MKEQLDDPEFVVEYKIDGLSMTLRYENGELVLAETRGDGINFGEDVTANAKVIGDVKKKLREAPEYLEIRGEVYMKNAAFEHHLQMSLEEMSLQTQYYEVKYGDFDVKIRHC